MAPELHGRSVSASKTQDEGFRGSATCHVDVSSWGFAIRSWLSCPLDGSGPRPQVSPVKKERTSVVLCKSTHRVQPAPRDPRAAPRRPTTAGEAPASLGKKLASGLSVKASSAALLSSRHRHKSPQQQNAAGRHLHPNGRATRIWGVLPKWDAAWACIRRWHPFASCSCPGLHEIGNAGTHQALRLRPAPTSTSFVSISPLPAAASCLATFCKRTFASFSLSESDGERDRGASLHSKDRKNIASSLKTCVSLRIRTGT